MHKSAAGSRSNRMEGATVALSVEYEEKGAHQLSVLEQPAQTVPSPLRRESLSQDEKTALPTYGTNVPSSS